MKSLITEKVYSPVEDKNIKNRLVESPIWKKCYKKEELTEEVLGSVQRMFEYTIKFDGLVPVQVTKVKVF